MNKGNDWIKPLLFVIATYVLSWSIFFFAGDNMILTTVGTCMPSIVGIVFLLLSKSDARKGMKKRIIGFRSIKWPWYLIMVFSFPVFFFLAFLILKLLGLETPNLNDTFEVMKNPALVAFLFLFTGLGAGVGEEFGWRGYFLDSLQKRFGALVSSLIVGVIWAAWHIPMRLIQGVDLLSWVYLIDFLMIVSFSFFLTWIYNNNRGSILAAILTHSLINGTLTTLSGAKPLPLAMSATITLLIVIFVVVISIFGKSHGIDKKDLRPASAFRCQPIRSAI